MNSLETVLLFLLTMCTAIAVTYLAVRGVFRILQSVISGMNRFEKIAWFNLAMFMVSLLILPVLIWCYRTIHIKDPLEMALQLTAILWATEWGRYLFKKSRIKVAPEPDERDQRIRKRAIEHEVALIGMALLLFLIGMCGHERVCFQRGIVLTVVGVVLGFAQVVRSLSIVIQYRADLKSRETGKFGTVIREKGI